MSYLTLLESINLASAIFPISKLKKPIRITGVCKSLFSWNVRKDTHEKCSDYFEDSELD